MVQPKRQQQTRESIMPATVKVPPTIAQIVVKK